MDDKSPFCKQGIVAVTSRNSVSVLQALQVEGYTEQSFIGRNQRFEPEWDDSDEEASKEIDDLQVPSHLTSPSVASKLRHSSVSAGSHVRHRSVEFLIPAGRDELLNSNTSTLTSIDSVALPPPPFMRPGIGSQSCTLSHSIKIRRRSALAALAASRQSAEWASSEVTDVNTPSHLSFHSRKGSATNQDFLMDTENSVASVNPLFDGPAEMDLESLPQLDAEVNPQPVEEESTQINFVPQAHCNLFKLPDSNNGRHTDMDFRPHLPPNDFAHESHNSAQGIGPPSHLKPVKSAVRLTSSRAGSFFWLLILLLTAASASGITWLAVTCTTLFSPVSLLSQLQTEHWSGQIPLMPTSTQAPPMLQAGQQATLTITPAGELMWVVLVPAAPGTVQPMSIPKNDPAQASTTQTVSEPSSAQTTTQPALEALAAMPTPKPALPVTTVETEQPAHAVDAAAAAAAAAAVTTSQGTALQQASQAQLSNDALQLSTHEHLDACVQGTHKVTWPSSVILIATGVVLGAVAIAMIVIYASQGQPQDHRGLGEEIQPVKFSKLLNLLRLRNGRVVDVWG